MKRFCVEYYHGDKIIHKEYDSSYHFTNLLIKLGFKDIHGLYVNGDRLDSSSENVHKVCKRFLR
jgi:hypothetical protein